MRVQSDVKIGQNPSRPAASSGSKNALMHAVCAGGLGAAAMVGARAIGLDPGYVTLGLGVGLEDADPDSKVQAVAFSKVQAVALSVFLFLGLALITKDWQWGVAAGSLLVGEVGGEGIARVTGIDRLARKSIGGGVAAGAGAVILVHLMSGSGSTPIIDVPFVGLMASLLAWSISADPRLSEQKPATISQVL